VIKDINNISEDINYISKDINHISIIPLKLGVWIEKTRLGNSNLERCIM